MSNVVSRAPDLTLCATLLALSSSEDRPRKHEPTDAGVTAHIDATIVTHVCAAPPILTLQ